MEHLTECRGPNHELKNFYQARNKGPFLLELVPELCRQTGIPKKPNDLVVEMDISFHPLLVKVLSSKKRIKRKTGEANSRKEDL